LSECGTTKPVNIKSLIGSFCRETSMKPSKLRLFRSRADECFRLFGGLCFFWRRCLLNLNEVRRAKVEGFSRLSGGRDRHRDSDSQTMGGRKKEMEKGKDRHTDRDSIMRRERRIEREREGKRGGGGRGEVPCACYASPPGGGGEGRGVSSGARNAISAFRAKMAHAKAELAHAKKCHFSISRGGGNVTTFVPRKALKLIASRYVDFQAAAALL